MRNEMTGDRYVNPYTDFGFKMLFGSEINKELLISFVNSLLGGREVIRDLKYLNTEHLGTSERDRRAVFDVYCENERGEKILVEMRRTAVFQGQEHLLLHIPDTGTGTQRRVGL